MHRIWRRTPLHQGSRVSPSARPACGLRAARRRGLRRGQFPAEEAGRPVQGGVRLVEPAVVVLEDVRQAGPDFEGDLDVVGARAAGQPDGVVEQHLVRRRPGRAAGAARSGRRTAGWPAAAPGRRRRRSGRRTPAGRRR